MKEKQIINREIKPPVSEEDSKTHRDRYRVFIEDVADGFYETNIRGDFKFFNDALCRIFGYSRSEIQDHNYREFMDKKNAEIAFDSLNKIYRTGKDVFDIKWEIIRKDGETRYLEIFASLIVDDYGRKVGFRGIARDVSREKRAAKTNQALFRIAKALHQYPRLDERLEFIAKEVQDLLFVKGAFVILIDEDKQEFFFRVAAYEDKEAVKRFKEIRFPADKGVAGHVYRTGQPLIVPDTSKSPYFFKHVDEQSGYETQNMLDVPIQIQDRMIGVLCAVNKKEGEFDQTDVELLSTIGILVGLPIENARINEELNRSFKEVKSLNRAKDRVIHHLSHELKTPISVLAASLALLTKKLSGIEDQSWKSILDRAQRNLDRLLEMQYEIEDILREKEYKTYHMLSTLLDVCTDELEALVSDELDDKDVVQKIRLRVESLFGPRESIPQEIQLDQFAKESIQSLRPRFAHRKCNLVTKFESAPSIFIPSDVLSKIVEGLIRNAVENTPDGARIEVTVRNGKKGPVFEVKDFGVGITEDNQRLIFESNFTTYETMQYSSKNKYDFNAGGKGFDLLRMKIFSERYNFKIRMKSNRCRFIPRDEDLCPGNYEDCSYCQTIEDCLDTGGTTMIVQFFPVEQFLEKKMNKAVIMDGNHEKRE